MLTLQDLIYFHSNKELLFEDVNLTVNKHDKIALIGNNGSGKSTILKILAGVLQPSQGVVHTSSKPYYMPQLYGQFNHYTIAEALQINDKIKALKQILEGDLTESNFRVLNDDWTIEERCAEALTHWKLEALDLEQKMDTLSGGQKTKVFLSGIFIHQPEIVLLDEPSNHLDTPSRDLLYNFIRSTKSTLVVVSHDRKLLNLLTSVCELYKKGITVYGGNYDFYTEQKRIETNALHQDLKNKVKALKKAKESERKSLERKQKLDARGKKSRKNPACLP